MSLLLAACGNAAVNQHSARGDDYGPERQTDKSGDGHSVVSAVLDLQQPPGFEALTSVLTTRRVVYVGETHDNYAHHKAQLAVITALHESGADLAIGMEMFQQPFQPYLDDYIAGKISEAEMLRKTEWYERWVYDYRHYRPILNFAKENSIPVIALNIPREITGRVSKEGIESLNEAERDQIPADIDYSDEDYTERLKGIFRQHAEQSDRSFERFLQVQLLWDESMALTATEYLKAHPKKQLVILAGSGHLMHSSGIPNRVWRRQRVSSAVVLPGGDLKIEPGIADFVLFPKAVELPPAAVMGIYMGQADKGVHVSDVVKEGAADRGGVKRDDVILAFDGEVIDSPNDVRIQLLGKKPGDSARLTLLRQGILFGEKRLDVDLVLGQ